MLTASLLTGFALKSLVLAGLTLALIRFTKRRTPAERSLIAHLGLLAVLLMPAASLVLPEWAPLPQHLFAAEPAVSPVSAPIASAPAMVEPAPVAAAPVAFAPPSAEQLAVWVYALPLILMFAMMAIAVLRLFGMRRRAEVLVDGAWLSALAGAQRRMGFKHGTALLVSEELRSPISWGVLRPTILLNPHAVASVGDAEAIIAHELAHVARLDWAKLLIARLACALFWFNPLVWMLARESHQLREEAADDTVLLTDIPGSDYATLLVNAARHDNSGVLIAAHGVAPGKNSLRRRVVRVLDANVRRGPAGSGWGVLGLIAVLAIAAPLAAFTTVASRAVEDAAAPSSAHKQAHVGSPDVARQHLSGKPLTADDLIAMKAVGVEPADLAQARDSHGNIDADTAIAIKATGVTPAYIAEMRGVFAGVSADDLIGAGAVGVDAAYARAMRNLDPRADLDTVIGARAVGVTAAYANEMRTYFPRVSLDDLTSMRATGVTGSDIRTMRGSGMSVTEPDDVVAVKAVTGRRGPSAVQRGPGTIRAVRPGATAIIGPEGVFASRRNPDGTVTTAVTRSPPDIDIDVDVDVDDE